MLGQEIIECEIAIVGASLAGSSAAIELARSSQSVLLIEADEFPRGKACGEGLSSRGVELISSFGPILKTIPHRELQAYNICLGDKNSRLLLCEEDNYGFESAIGVDRALLDHALFQFASNYPGVSTLVGTRVLRAEQSSDRCSLSLSDGREVRCKFLVIASGAGQKFRSDRSPGPRLKRYGYSWHVKLPVGASIPDEVQIIIEPRFDMYVTPVGRELVNIAVLSEKSQFPGLFSESGRMSLLSRLEKQWNIKLDPISPPLPTGPLGNLRRSGSEGRLFFVGDACEQFDPVGGMGMTHALLSGKLAGESLGLVLRNTLPLREAAKRYEHLRSEDAKVLRGFTRLSNFMLRTIAGSGISSALASSIFAQQAANALHSNDHRPITRISRKLVELVGL